MPIDELIRMNSELRMNKDKVSEGLERENPATMLENALLIVAHPDDEILWFSSIVDRVDKMVFCYIDSETNPTWGPGRRKALKEYSNKTISNLDILESEVFSNDNWRQPMYTSSGIRIDSNSLNSDRYSKNYIKVKEKLEREIDGYKNVITHNPWGDYGNEEHVQVYRAIKDLQKELGFALWFSNYCSNKSIELMFQFVSGFRSDYITLATDKSLAKKMKSIYSSNDCWTWYEDWEWFNEECFIQDKNFEDNNAKEPRGHIFPLNMIKLKFLINKKKRLRASTIFLNALMRFLDRRARP